MLDVSSSLGPLHLVAVAAAGVAGGAVNALAGGGTLLTFPVLTAVGVPALAANITNTVALCPGHFGASLAQARSLRGQRGRLMLLVPAGIVGGLAGGVLLLHTGEKTFRDVVPVLLLVSTLLLAVQERVRAWLVARGSHGSHAAWAPVAVATASVYGGYFGAGLGVVLVATLGMVLDEPLPRLNALKQVLALVVNVAAAIFFLFSEQVVWVAAVVLAAGALAGGVLGGRLSTSIDPATLRRTMVGIGAVLSVVYLVT